MNQLRETARECMDQSDAEFAKDHPICLICFIAIFAFVLTKLLFFIYYWTKKVMLNIQLKLSLPLFLQQNLKFIIVWFVISFLVLVAIRFEVNSWADERKKKPFDYKKFVQSLKEQALNCVPEQIAGDDRIYLLDKIEENSLKVSEALVDGKYTNEQCEFIIQVIAEWTYHKTVDLISGGIKKEYRDSIISRVYCVIYEALKNGFIKKSEEQEILAEIEKQVKEMYKNCIKDLYSKGDITFEIYNNAINKSNIDYYRTECNETEE